jgi:outer membrane protein assembly factor BamE (lipoprotein component of BamABCDE complex)
MQSHRRLKRAGWAVAAALAAASMAACTPTIDYRGYQAPPNAMQQVQPGMSKTEVEALLGSPSTTATINTTGDSYYYISSIVETRAFLDPEEINRTVIAIRFSPTDQVESFAQYGLQDGQIIDMNTNKTPTHGKELTILQQIFSNIGRFNPVNP